jgi:hypothetical protein
MSEYPIGVVVVHKDEQYRVVRIIGQSTSLFEDDKQVYLQIESYVELKGADGSIDFVTLEMERKAYEGGPSIIKGLDPINWSGS